MKHIGVRWTIGDVSLAGFEALQISLWSMWRLLGDGAQYAVCVNTTPLDAARARTGGVPETVRWIQSDDQVPRWLLNRVDPQMAEGVAWKFAPVRLFPECYEISLDNDVILWGIPPAMQSWLEDDSESFLLAEDVARCLGQFSSVCDCGPINSGIRGIPPGFDLEARLRATLAETNVTLRSELDEQGLQAAALSHPKMFMVTTEDVSICSPFPMHQHGPGRCGVHFVGLNAKSSPWRLGDRMAHEAIRENWEKFRPRLIAVCDGIPAAEVA